MPRYMETAAEANKTAERLLSLVPEESKHQAAEHIARLVNFGIRCSPRVVQHTVRINAVKRAVQGLPVRCRLEERTSPQGKTYKALVTEPIN